MTHADAAAKLEATPLQMLAHGDLEQVRALLDADPSLVDAMNAVDWREVDEIPQHAAAHVGARPILEELLDRGVALDPFMAAALGRRDELAGFLDDGFPADAAGPHGIPLLLHARDPETIALLLDRGAPADATSMMGGALHAAARRGDLDSARLLIERGADPNSSAGGATPLHWAAAGGHATLASWLLGQGASPLSVADAGPLEGKAPAVIAEEKGHTELARQLGEAADAASR